MLGLASRMLRREKVKSLITIAGAGTLLMLILFLTGIYEGVKSGSTGYIANSPAHIWACQKNSTNLLRSSSFLNSSTGDELSAVDGVKKVEGILRILTTAQIHHRNVTAFIFGLPPESELSRPPIHLGRTSLRIGEIILDKSFVAKNAVSLGDTIDLNGYPFIIAGISNRTNATVTQFSFVTMADAQTIIGFENITSFFLISLQDPAAETSVLNTLRKEFPSLSFYSKEEFIANNLDEMKTGVLPILWTIAMLGMITGGAIISLMLYTTVLERREDYALLKALGMSQIRIALIVVRQALVISLGGYLFAFCGYGILSPLLSYFAPEITVEINGIIVVSLLVVASFLGCAGSLASVKKLSSIYPTEVFRA